MELSVRIYGEPILRTICEEANDLLKPQLISMKVYLSKMAFAVGLAAPQVGINGRAFCMRDNGNNLLTVVNPIIRKRSGVMPFSEGCLSLPGIYGKTEIRSKFITADFFDENFNRCTRTFNGTEAVIFQHEYDHLLGVLFIDHLNKEGKDKIEELIDKIERHPVRTYHPLFIGDNSETTLVKLNTFK